MAASASGKRDRRAWICVSVLTLDVGVHTLVAVTKNATLILRVDSDAKERIVHAAQRAGRSVSDLVLEATMQTVQRIESAQPKQSATSGPCPTFFKALCATAQTGGQHGYWRAGYELARHVHRLVPHGVEPGEWDERVYAVSCLAVDGSYEDVARWFAENLPRCMALVPKRRHAQFVEGVREFHEQVGITV